MGILHSPLQRSYLNITKSSFLFQTVKPSRARAAGSKLDFCLLFVLSLTCYFGSVFLDLCYWRNSLGY